MHAPETVRRFVELRAQGWTYARLETELNVTKPTLIDWSRKHQFEIQNLHAIELEALRAKWLASTSEHVDAIGEQLRRVEIELADPRSHRAEHASTHERRPQPPSPDRASHRPAPVQRSGKRNSFRRIP
ncbi:MAG: hypothetical protein JWO95_2752 [Verrucomicrobiales bacterium]|nr:hypothetical protein [Verrucomicrobiales bacterium]